MTSITLPFSGTAVELAPQSGIVTLLGVVAAPLTLAFIVTLARRELRYLPRSVALTLLGLRLAVVSVILLTLLLDPTVARVKRDEVRGRILVAFDRSDSMQIRDEPSATRFDRALRSAPLDELNEKHAVEVVAFDNRLSSLSEKSQPPAFTDLKLPLRQALNLDRLLGVVIFTDGRHTWGDSPLGLAEELGHRNVPVDPVLVAPPVPPPDVAVMSVRPLSSTVFRGSVVPIETEIRITGQPVGPINVKLLPNDLHEAIQHTGVDAVYRLTLKAKMDEVGPRTLTITASRPNAPDRFPANDSRSIRVNVVKDRARVLLIDGDSRWEFHYLRSCLEQDENMEVRAVVFRQPRLTQATDDELKPLNLPGREMPSEPDALTQYDCVFLGDVEPGQFSLAERERLERYVADAGGTVVMSAGKRALPLAFAEDDPLRKLLPVKRPRIHDDPTGFRLALTPDAERAWFLAMDDNPGTSREVWERFPLHYWAVIGDAKDGAEVLAALPGKPPRESAIIARQSYGFGRVLYVGLDSTWRWRFKTGDSYHHRFWGQVAQWAASDRLLPTTNASGTIRFGAREPTYRPGQDVEVIVRTREPVKKRPDMRVAKLIRLANTTRDEDVVAGLVPLTLPDSRPHDLSVTFRSLTPGRYAVELDVPEWAEHLRGPPRPDGRPQSLRSQFEVLPPDGEELADLSGNRELLERIAAASGGKVYTLETVGELVETLTARTATREEVVRRPARQSWWLLGLVVLLLTAEWGLRKWQGLP